MLMSNGLHYQGARQKGNGMIAPIIPACSPFPPLLFSLCLLAIQTVSPLASSLSSPFPPFTTSLLLPRPTSVQLEEVPHLLHTEEEGGGKGAGVGEEAYAKWRLYIERKRKEKFRMERRKKETERRKIVYCKCNHTLQLARRVFKSLSVVNAANRCVATDHRCEKVKQLSLDFFGHIWFSFLQHPEKMDFWYTSSIKKDINTCGFPLRKN